MRAEINSQGANPFFFFFFFTILFGKSVFLGRKLGYIIIIVNFLFIRIPNYLVGLANALRIFVNQTDIFSNVLLFFCFAFFLVFVYSDCRQLFSFLCFSALFSSPVFSSLTQTPFEFTLQKVGYYMLPKLGIKNQVKTLQ